MIRRIGPGHPWMLAIALLMATPAHAFKPKTHVWIAQQVINDVLDDGRITIVLCVNRRIGTVYPWTPTAPCEQRTYQVPDDVVKALREAPAAYRAGHVGPDAFPDFVVGQMTAHPGVPGAWKTNHWLRWLLSLRPRGEQARAFGFGYLGHAAGDLFGHTYVNAYSGDVFLLSDGETSVESRHMALESFIDLHLPPLVDHTGRTLTRADEILAVPNDLLAGQLILNDTVADQYWQPQAASPHVAIMQAIARAAAELAALADRLPRVHSGNIRELENKALDLANEIDKRAGFLAQRERELAIAKAALDVFDTGLAELDKAIAGLEHETAQLATKLEGLAREVATLPGQINDLKVQVDAKANDLAGTPATIRKEVTEKVCSIPVISEVCKVVSKFIDGANPLHERIENELNGLRRNFDDAQARLSAAATERAATEGLKLARDSTLLTTREKRAKLQVQREVNKHLIAAVEHAQQAVAQAQVARDKAVEEARRVKATLDRVRDIFGDAASIRAAIHNWQNDIGRAAAQYIDASRQAAGLMLAPGGDIVAPYMEWMKCWSPVFLAVPSHIPQAGCGIVATVQHAKNQIHEFRKKIHDQVLGETGGWLLDPAFKMEREIDKKVMPKLNEAGIHLVGQIGGTEMKLTARLLTMGITEGELNDFFNSDAGNKGLLKVPDMGERARKDMQVTAGVLNPDRFMPLRNAIVLAKLSLISGEALNQLARDAGVWPETMYGSNVFDDGPEANVLADAVRSIDGDHQWHRHAPLLPRRAGFADSRPRHLREHGYEPPLGLRLWQSRKAYSLVFLGIFKGPLAPGLADFQVGAFYRPTENDPFPRCHEVGYPCEYESSPWRTLTDAGDRSAQHPRADEPKRR